MALSLLTRRLAVAGLLALGPVVGWAQVPGLPPGGGPVGVKVEGPCRYQLKTRPRTMTCEGRVKIWRQDLSLSCNKLTAVFSASGNLDSARCSGAVEIVTTTATAKADEARFDGTRNEVELVGKPKLVSSGSVLHGKVITLNVSTGDVAVENPDAVILPDSLPALPEALQGRGPGGQP